MMNKNNKQLVSKFFHHLSYLLLFALGLIFGTHLNLHFTNLSFHLTTFTQFRCRLRHRRRHCHRPPPATSVLGWENFWSRLKLITTIWERRNCCGPRLGEFPYEKVPKVAFLFLTRQTVNVAPLWERFFKGNEGLYSIYVHSNPSSNETEPSLKALFLAVA